MSMDQPAGRSESSELEELCIYCRIGSLQPSRATYARWHDGQFVIRPGVAAWRCDFCGEFFFDSKALAQLVLLLGPQFELEDPRRWNAAGWGEGWDGDLGDRRRAG